MLPQDLLYWVDQELRNFKGPIVPGIALAVIDLDLPRGEQVEFHCWGNAKEEGQVVDQDVSSGDQASCRVVALNWTYGRVMLKLDLRLIPNRPSSQSLPVPKHSTQLPSESPSLPNNTLTKFKKGLFHFRGIQR